MNIVLMANDTTFIYNLRKEVVEGIIETGNRITIIGEVLAFENELRELGVDIINIKIPRRRTNILEDLNVIEKYFCYLTKLKPDLVFTNNIKPNCYGGIVCRILHIRYIPNITGLGTAVENPGKLQKLTILLYKFAAANAVCIFFQNSDNEKFFSEHEIRNKKNYVRLLPGSGVNLDRHRAKEYPKDDIINFLYVARVMKEKGINQYLAAAKVIYNRYPNTVFHICGMCDDPEYQEILRQAEQDGYIRYHGQQRDMVPFFEMAHCIVHPSYYPEGMSNVLLEAAATARPIIASNRSGCRETVDDGVTGFVVPVKDDAALITVLEKFMGMSWEQRRAMGIAGRKKMEREFDRKIVVNAYLDEIERNAKVGENE